MSTIKKIFWVSFLALVLPTAIQAATLSGTVTDNTATPIVGAKVVLIVSGAGGPQRLDSAITNALGQYTLTNVATGTVLLQASATGFLNGSSTVTVANAAGSYTANFTLLSSAGPTGTVAGAVTQAGNAAPIAGAVVRIFNVASGVLDSARTDTLGRYTIAGIPVGAAYTMMATHPGHNTVLRNAVAITANTTATQNFTMQITATIRGTVTNSTNGSPIAGARVILTLPSSGTFVPETTTTTAQGTYSFDSVSNGNQYLITVSATGFQTATNNTVTITDARRSGIADFSLVPVTGGNTGSITGLISSANSGLPIAGAQVILTRGGGFADTVITNSSGQYRFDSVPQQNGYTVTANAATFNQNTRLNVVVTTGQTAVVDITLLSSTGVFGNVDRDPGYGTEWIGGKMILNLGAATRFRTVGMYGLDGTMRYRLTVPVGVTKVEVPVDIGPGIIRVK